MRVNVNSKLESQLHFLAEADKMKSVSRETILIDASREETDAEHSWHFALMAMTLFEYCGVDGVDLNRVIRMALVHDLVEIYAGDSFAYDAAACEDQEEREKEAADRLFSILPEGQGREYRLLWEEFDRMETPDALYAAAVDRFQPFLNNYYTGGHTWVKHGVVVESVRKRMAPIKVAMPEVWEFVEFVVTDSLAKGYLRG